MDGRCGRLYASRCGWRQYTDDASGRPYYFHVGRNETPWALPTQAIFLGEWVYVLFLVASMWISHADVVLHAQAKAKGRLAKTRGD